MKNCFKVLACFGATLLMATSAYAAKTQLYALDGRTLFVDENQVEIYTAEGMGWFLEKPVTMYAPDGRTIIVPADRVEAHKNVGWFLKDETDSEENAPSTDSDETVAPDTDVTVDVTASEPSEENVSNDKIAVQYTDGTVVTVPAYQIDMYKALGWVEAEESSDASIQQPAGEYITVYSYDGKEKQILSSELEKAKAEGWYGAYDEAVYAYAAFGDGADVLGASKLLEDKKYELAFNMVQDALDKIENTESEYVSLLYYLRSSITDAWREAANSPLGFINYWFSEKDGKDLVVFEYRNVSNSRIQSFKINFDICDAEGNIVETNSGSYYVNNLQMTPCEKKRVAWVIKTGDVATGIKNLKVTEVVFSDGTTWAPAN